MCAGRLCGCVTGLTMVGNSMPAASHQTGSAPVGGSALSAGLLGMESTAHVVTLIIQVCAREPARQRVGELPELVVIYVLLQLLKRRPPCSGNLQEGRYVSVRTSPAHAKQLQERI